MSVTNITEKFMEHEQEKFIGALVDGGFTADEALREWVNALIELRCLRSEIE